MVIEDGFASSRHARIERKPGGFILRDLRSRNGTYINGTRVFEALLDDGDRIRIGETDLFFACKKIDANPFLMTSKNPVWQSQLNKMSGIAESEFPVLLTGPSGTGKEILAQTIHRLSQRKNGPFVSVNCSALSESLVESELFGHLRGSFTGATGDRKGAFEAARTGTLFLDEIGDLPLSLQPKLLRALENSQIRPVGSDRSVDTNVRIVAATHHDLKKLVFEEKFRADLYFRLHVIQLQAPALRDRMEDFDDLLYSFARTMRVRFSHGAIQKLKTHSWPGNIRELKNAVARAKAYWGSDEIKDTDVDQLVDQINDPSGAGPGEGFKPSRSVIKEIEFEMIRNRLIANRGNQRKTAADLGMPKSTLHDRIKIYGIDVDKLLEGQP
jgi:DNA-binding NtrC family response regulator